MFKKLTVLFTGMLTLLAMIVVPAVHAMDSTLSSALSTAYTGWITDLLAQFGTLLPVVFPWIIGVSVVFVMIRFVHALISG